MSFLSSVFKKKPGGTFVGNLIRGAVKNIPVVGAALGNGGNMIPVGSSDGLTNNQLASGLQVQTPTQASGFSAGAAVASSVVAPVKNAFVEKLKKWWWVALVPFGMIVLFFILRKSSKQSVYRRRY